MEKLNLKAVSKYVEINIGEFHKRRLDKIDEIRLKEVLKAKNPYLFKAKNINKASELIGSITSAYISSSEEGAFGNWLERLAIFINKSVYGGRKASGEGMDLDFDRDGVRYIVSIKSGPKWGNDSQIKKLIDQITSVRKTLKTSGGKEIVQFVNGCCYGRSNPRFEYKAKGDYYKLCGQRFWELISGDNNLYIDLIKPLSTEAEEKNSEFNNSYDSLLNRLTKEFIDEFCFLDGKIDWEKLVKFNSATVQNKTPSPHKD